MNSEAETVDTRKTRKTFIKFPQSISLFFVQCFLTAFIGIFCMIQLALSSTRDLSCEEKSIYITLLSSTLGILSPPPSRNPDQKLLKYLKSLRNKRLGHHQETNLNAEKSEACLQTNKRKENSEQIEFSEIDLKTDPQSSSSSVTTGESLWLFGKRFEPAVVIFYSQTLLIVGLVIFSALRLCLKASTNCDERTAYLMIISTCLTFVLPSVSSKNK